MARELTEVEKLMEALTSKGTDKQKIDNLQGVIEDAAHKIVEISGKNADKHDYSDLNTVIRELKEA